MKNPTLLYLQTLLPMAEIVLRFLAKKQSILFTL